MAFKRKLACKDSGGCDSRLPDGQLGLLLHASNSVDSTVGQLARRHGISVSAVTQMADALETKGLLKRRSDPADRRLTLLELTDAGRDELAKWRQYIIDRATEVFDVLTDEELAELSRLHSKIVYQERKVA